MFTEILGGLSALGGLLGASNAQKAAEQARQQALLDAETNNDSLYQNYLANGDRNIQEKAGLAGDAVQNMGKRFGASLADAGIYDSSATAGALARAQANEQSALVSAGNQLQQNAEQLKLQGQGQINSLKLGQANQDYSNATANLDSSRSGLFSFLGSVAQANLQKQTNPYQGLNLGVNGNQNKILPPGQSYDPNNNPLVPMMKRPTGLYNASPVFGS